MIRSGHIVLGLGTPKEPLPPGANAQPAPARHWRRWAYGGVALSALLHLLIAGSAGYDLSSLRAHADETAIPVEVVDRTPEGAKLPPEPPREKPREETRVQPKPPEPPKPIPEVPKPLADPPKGAGAPPPPPAPAARPAPQRPAAAPAPPAPAPRTASATPATPAPAPRAAAPPPASWEPPATPPAPPQWNALRVPSDVPGFPPEPGGDLGPSKPTEISPDDAPLPKTGKAIAYWVLDPLVVRDPKCGRAQVAGVIELKEKLGEGLFRGELRRRIRSERCPEESGLYHVELRFWGNEVHMRIDEGFADRGVVRGNLMMMEDALGRSVWRKR